MTRAQIERLKLKLAEVHGDEMSDTAWAAIDDVISAFRDELAKPEVREWRVVDPDDSSSYIECGSEAYARKAVAFHTNLEFGYIPRLESRIPSGAWEPAA